MYIFAAGGFLWSPRGPICIKPRQDLPPLQEAYVRSGFIAIPTTRLREKRLIHAERRRGRRRPASEKFRKILQDTAVLSRYPCNNDAFLLQCSTRNFFPCRRLAQKRMTYWGGGCWPPFHFDRQPGQDISGKRRQPEIDVCLEERGEKRNGHKNLYFLSVSGKHSTKRVDYIPSERLIGNKNACETPLQKPCAPISLRTTCTHYVRT